MNQFMDTNDYITEDTTFDDKGFPINCSDGVDHRTSQINECVEYDYDLDNLIFYDDNNTPLIITSGSSKVLLNRSIQRGDYLGADRIVDFLINLDIQDNNN